MAPFSAHPDRLAAALRSLDGLSVGDAFGERFFAPPDRALEEIRSRSLPPGPWTFTDDTVMALSIVDVLAERGDIDRDRLADLFARRYRHDPRRGYGGTAHEILSEIAGGTPWLVASTAPFGGTGSMGNGGAMRAAPIGAFFASDYARTADAARASAEVTHAHAEGQAGAIAVAIAAAWMCRGGSDAADLFGTVLAHTPEGDTRRGIARAARLDLQTHVRNAASTLGSGNRVISSDTVPFSLWCVARHLADFEEAMWSTVSGLGDRDTTCAIVGGIVAVHPAAAIPPHWLGAREPLSAMGRDALGI
jgi:ADP-ribosylglycohydrolase